MTSPLGAFSHSLHPLLSCARSGVVGAPAENVGEMLQAIIPIWYNVAVELLATGSSRQSTDGSVAHGASRGSLLAMLAIGIIEGGLF